MFTGNDITNNPIAVSTQLFCIDVLLPAFILLLCAAVIISSG